MANLQAFETLKPEIQAVADDNVIPPNMPVDDAIRESEGLYHHALPHREQLVSRGLNPVYLDSLLQRNDALQVAEANWFRERYNKEEVQKEWAEKAPEAYDLRKLLLDEFEFAFYQDESLLNKLDQIKKGNGHSDMAQDLVNMGIFGKEHLSSLQITNFNENLLDKAIGTGDNIIRLLGIIDGQHKENDTAKLMRDKAFTYLKEAVDEIRRVGKFVFRHNKEQLEGYYSQYRREHR